MVNLEDAARPSSALAPGPPKLWSLLIIQWVSRPECGF